MKRVIRHEDVYSSSNSVKSLINKIDGLFNKGSKLFRTIASWGEDESSPKTDFVLEAVDGFDNLYRMLCKIVSNGEDGFTAKFIMKPKDGDNSDSVESDEVKILHQHDAENDDEYAHRVFQTCYDQATKLVQKLTKGEVEGIDDIKLVAK